MLLVVLTLSVGCYEGAVVSEPATDAGLTVDRLVGPLDTGTRPRGLVTRALSETRIVSSAWTRVLTCWAPVTMVTHT